MRLLKRRQEIEVKINVAQSTQLQGWFEVRPGPCGAGGSQRLTACREVLALWSCEPGPDEEVTPSL